MKLYEINLELMQLYDQLAVDPETGEIIEKEDDTLSKIDALQMRKKDVLEYLAKLVLNNRADMAALKAEEDRLAARRRATAKKTERLMHILDRECGEKTDLGVATLRYTRTTRLEVPDAQRAYRYLKRRKLVNCFRVPDPVIDKNEVKKLAKRGVKVPGTVLIEDRSVSLR